MINKILDLDRPFTNVGPKDDEGYLWKVQGGHIYGWSESNIRYELAWWLDIDGTVLNVDKSGHGTPSQRRHQARLNQIAQDRPFDPAWLL